ncbi:Aste57867_10894 [Aphanomyces stellatus]|uniref:Aste57867_10894 protein n=1 Tax=Aphanomyces stellatus TaxID=120398 RepID=A0A485KS37_9STRA|nr:hypothetical protein As57867_010854 [Aphanomyces stellatus]VFT87762.1 Aste57867_10894 [Aphanomyces stellatus]
MEDESWQRTLEHLTGVQGLNKSEIRKDVKEVEQLLEEQRHYVEKHQDEKPKIVKEEADEDVALARRRRQQHLANLYLNKPMPKKKRSRGREVMSAEEIIETLPICRRAVRLTQTELVAVKKERLDLEDTYLKLRSSFIHELEMMMKEEKDQQRVMLRIRKRVAKAAEKLLSSKRRNTALQGILTELDARGDAVEKLQRQVARLTKLLGEVPLDSILVGDAVKWDDGGEGVVESIAGESATVKLAGDGGEVVSKELEALELVEKPSACVYSEDESQLKAKYFEKAGEWVTAETALKDLLEKNPELEDEWDDSDDEDNEPAGEGGDAPPAKKARSLIPFKASTLKSTPYDVPLLISPLSELPDHVAAAAVGLSNIQWMGSALPQDLVDWEADRQEALTMKGEIERLKFQLRQAEAQKKDAQNHVNVQLESINKLVSQLEKQREATAAATALLNEAKEANKNKKPAVAAAPSNNSKKKERKDSMSESNSTPASPMKHDDMSGDEENGDDDEKSGSTRRTLRSSKAPPVPSPVKDKTVDDKASTNANRRKKEEPKSKDEKKDDADADKTTNGGGTKAPTTRRMSSRSKGTVKSPTNKLDDVSETEEEPAAESTAKRRTRT